MTKRTKTFSWILQILVAVILGQTLFFKFTGAPEARQLFETLGAEPWGRFGTGIVEAIAVILILIPRRAGLGALLSLGLMGGAIGSHLTTLGIEVQGDGGTLFAMAVVVFLSAAAIAWMRRSELPVISRFLAEGAQPVRDPNQSR